MGENRDLYERASRVTDAAGAAGGLDEVRRIAERRWPSEVDGQVASAELRDAIQERARGIVACGDCGAESGPRG